MWPRSPRAVGYARGAMGSPSEVAMGLFKGWPNCTHVPAVAAGPRAEVCESCGSDYNLRVCTQCGFVGCCESQAGHDREHALTSGHPVIRSLPPGRHAFTWCYECGRYVETDLQVG